MEEGPTRLNALSEMLVLSTYGNTKNVLVTAAELRGPLDREAVTLAVQRAAQDFPRLTSCIKEVKEHGKYYLVWVYRPDLSIPVTFSDLHVARSSTPFDAFVELMAPRLNRDWDLFREVPTQFYCLKLSEDLHIAGPAIHHVAADAGVAADFGRDVLLHYHEIVKGHELVHACQPHAISGAKKRLAPVRQSTWRDLAAKAREAVAHAMERPTLPVGTGAHDDRAQHHVKRLLSREETDRVGKVNRRHRVSLVDLLVTCANVAIERWNDVRGIPPGVLTTSMSVNMKGRFEGFDSSNNSALLFFKSLPEHRRDPVAYTRSVTLKRIKSLTNQIDLKFLQNVSGMTEALRRFPFPMRRRIVYFLMNRHQVSVAVTFLGVIWPETNLGKRTLDSCVTRAGDLTAIEVHGVGYKLLSSTQLLLIAYFFQGRLNLVLAASGSLFTRKESDAFIDLIIDTLLRDPAIVSTYNTQEPGRPPSTA